MMNGLVLTFQPSAQQRQRLSQRLDELQDPASASYHRWLTPEESADLVGLSAGDLRTVENWLRSQGFQILYTARARDWVAFSGTVAEAQRTFQAPLHRFEIAGEAHIANTAEPSLPAALADVVGSLRGLDDFRLRPPGRGGAPARSPVPNYTNLVGTHYLAPDDLAAIYDINRLYSAGYDGTGQKIAVVGQSDFHPADIAAFRSIFNLPANTPQTIRAYNQYPGIVSPDVTEAELDIEWAGAIARNATILYVLSNNVLDSVQYAIDQNLAPVISMSYGGCEIGNANSFLDSWRVQAQKAALQGITWVTSSGDTGAASCEVTDPPPTAASGGKTVSFPASIPEVTAVGGTTFDEGSGSYWSYFNGDRQGSANSYIPERAWNDTSARGTLSSTGGGFSAHYPKPAWQQGSGFPTSSFRLVPDVALAASPQHDAYIYCDQTVGGSCPSSTVWLLQQFGKVGGTSAGTPVFAGMLALLNGYLVQNGVQSQPGVGNVNPALYWLAQNSPSAFHDVAGGDNIVPCVSGTSDCASGSFGYSAGTGYDLATGLGSVSAYNLATAFLGLTIPHVTQIAPASPSASSQNQTITVTGSGFQSGLTVRATFPNGGSSILQGAGQVTFQNSGSFQLTITLNASGPWTIQVTDPDGRVSNVFPFTVGAAVQAPTVSTGAVSGVTSSFATIGGSANPNGADTHAWLTYSTHSDMSGSTATPQQDIGAGNSSLAFSANLGALSANTTYYYQAWASNSAGSNHGLTGSFTTGSSSGAPLVTTTAAFSIAINSATLSGSVNANNLDTQVWFLYGIDSSMANSTATPKLGIGHGNTALPVSFNLSNLGTAYTYYFQAWASNAAGTSQGAVLSFTTLPGVGAPTVNTSAASAITSNSATLAGSVSPNGFDTHVWFQYSTSASMIGSVTTPQLDIGSGAGSYPYSANIAGLAAGTTYYYQAWASNSSGSATGSILNFATPGAQLPSQPGGLTPAAGSTNVSLSPTLSWSPVANATGYTVFFGANNNPWAAATNSGSNSTTFTPGLLSGSTTYYWRVVATNASGQTSSPLVSFTTQTAPVSGPVLVSGLSNPVAIAQDSDSIYWSEFGGLIRKVAKTGGSPSTLYASLYNPTGLTVDATRVFFCDGANIRSVPKGGGATTVLASGTCSRIAQDANNIYWTDYGAGTVLRLPKTGGSPATLASGSNSPAGIATDGVNVYWSEESWPGYVRKVPVNGGSVTLLGFNVNNVGIALDPTSTNVFWGEYVLADQGKIDFTGVNGGATTTIATGLNNVWDVVTDGSSAFWAEDRVGGAVRQVSLSGGSIATLGDSLAEPIALTVDANNVYWLERNGGAVGSGSLKAVAKKPVVQVVVGTAEQGLTYVVDGQTYTSQQTFVWLQGSTHIIGADAVQSGGGQSHALQSWSDGGAATHSITVNFNASYIATYTTQNRLLVTNLTPSAGSVVSAPGSATGYYDEGATVQLTASPSLGYIFAGWRGDVAGAANPVTVTMNAPRTIGATFALAPPVLNLAILAPQQLVQGQINAVYSVTVTNLLGAGATVGPVTVTQNLPTSLSLVSMSGVGWTCSPGSNTCSRNDGLFPGASYPVLQVTVNVAGNATSPAVTSVTVSGGGSASLTTTVLTPVQAPSGLSCFASAPVPQAARVEGFSEVMGDIVIGCLGGAPPQPNTGVALPTTDIVVTLNVPVTNRLLDGANSVSDALLFIDDPGSNYAAPGWGNSWTQSRCATPLTGCPAYAQQINGVTVLSSTPCVSGGACGSGSLPAAPSPAANIFQGVVRGNQVIFYGVPVLPAPTGAGRILRIANVRASVTGLSAVSGPVPVLASIVSGGANPLPLSNPVQTVAFAQVGLNTAVRDPANATLLTAGAPFGQCVGSISPVSVGLVQFGEGFATAFKTRVVPSVTYNGQSANPTQNVPGTISPSESQVVLPQAQGDPVSPGLADFGTRLKAVFTGIPAGVRVFVSTTNLGTTSDPTPNAPGPGNSAAYAVLVTDELTADGDGVTPLRSNTATVNNGTTRIYELSVSGGTATAVWEVINGNPFALDTLSFGVWQQFVSNAPPAGTALATLEYGPSPAAFSAAAGAAASSTLPFPRFVNAAVTVPIFAVNACPVLNSVAPNTTPAFTGPINVTASGSNFVSGAAIQWTAPGGTTVSLPASFVNAAQLQATLPAALLTTPGTAQVTVVNPGNQLSGQIPFIITAPLTPGLTAIQPNNAPVNSPPLAFSATGSNFAVGSALRWTAPNGSVVTLPTDFVSAAGLQATLPSTLFATAGTAQVAVINPSGLTSTTLPFVINPLVSPVLANLTPNAAPVGTGPITLTAGGSSFVSGATLQWTAPNGTPLTLPASFINSAQLQAVVPSSYLVTAGTAQVAVVNPGNQLSGSLSFVVTPPVTAVVAASAVAPNSGSGATQTFTGVYSSSNGYQALRWVQMLFAVASDGGGQSYCFVHYDVQGNSFWVYGDGGFFVGPVSPGAASNRLQNSFCSLNTSGSSASGAGPTLSINANVVFKGAGARNIYLRAQDIFGTDTGWTPSGTWNTAAATVGALSVSPSSGSASTQTFTLTYPDPPGFAGAAFGWVQFLIAAASDGGGQPFCFAHYDRAGNGLWMYSSDVGFFLGPVAPGAASNLLSSSACSINTAATTVVNTGGNLVVTMPVTMKAPMSGTKKTFQRTLDVLNRDTGWQQTGSWIVP